jgi:hypothetical protein
VDETSGTASHGTHRLPARGLGAPTFAGAARVTFWGAVAMGCTALVGRIFGTVM